MELGEVWTSAEWNDREEVVGYRAVWFGEKLVERVTFGSAVTPYGETGPLAGASWSGQVMELVRFWLAADDQVVDKAFDARGEVLGYYSPVTRPLEREGDCVRAKLLLLGLRMDPDGRVTVTGETVFDAAVAAGDLTPVETEHAEHRIRTMTAAAASGKWPPPFVRNFQFAEGVSSHEVD